MSIEKHSELIVDQFTRQAIKFSEAKVIADKNSLMQLVDFSEPKTTDHVLDVACGGGIVLCGFAGKSAKVIGIDMTDAMLDTARKKIANVGLNNARVDKGTAYNLPYENECFDIVVTRFSFHHFQEPEKALLEMKRVCKQGGTIVVADVTASEDEKQAACFNQMERWRDPSHVRNLSLSELLELFKRCEFSDIHTAFYELRDVLDNLLARSFPNPGDDLRIREVFQRSLHDDCLGIPVEETNGFLEYAYPVQIIKAKKAIMVSVH